MNIKNVMSKAAIVAVSIGLAAVSAHAGPPRDSGRDVIGDAYAICDFPAGYIPTSDLGTGSDEEIRAFACDLLFKSDGDLENGVDKCKLDPPDSGTGNGYVTYKGRNCAKNEAAQQRKAATVVLSMDDLIERDKSQQSLTATIAACEYQVKADFLLDVEKMDDGGIELANDAAAIADALGEPDCEYFLSSL